MYLSYNTDQIHQLLNESKNWIVSDKRKGREYFFIHYNYDNLPLFFFDEQHIKELILDNLPLIDVPKGEHIKELILELAIEHLTYF
jgi:hypothetical protein